MYNFKKAACNANFASIYKGINVQIKNSKITHEIAIEN